MPENDLEEVTKKGKEKFSFEGDLNPELVDFQFQVCGENEKSLRKKKKHQSRRRKVRISEISFILFVLIQKRVSLLSVYKPGQGEIDPAALSFSPKNRKQYVKTWESGIFCQS
ncbi:hypothetical protein RUM43_006428 [Polyplax serrata]|uniref:Uncharacterized protein n=1 Tax=Polyplax serrata TaxID=468196 RepID=A0AAN8S259_POLSC